MKLIKHASTLIPAAFIALFFLAIITSLDGAYTWERPITYAATGICLLLGIIALITLGRAPMGQTISLFLLVQIWHKIGLMCVYISILTASVFQLYPEWVPFMPDWLIWALLVACSGMVCISNLVLFFGCKRQWLTAETHGLPFGHYLAKRKSREDRV